MGKLIKTKAKLHIVKKFEKSEQFFSSGMLVYIENGKGDLFETFFRENGNECYTLQFKDQLLFQLQGDEYFCPTCEKIVRTAYGLQQTDEFHLDKINQEGIELDEFVADITPLLCLLRSGFYCLWDTELYPTDGNGNLFWDYPNDNNVMPGSCIFYFGDGEWGTCLPHYMIATQPKKLLNMERVNYYRNKPDCRAIAYYMDGNIAALLDGHHKAMAASMEHIQCSTLVISKCFSGYQINAVGEKRRYLNTNDSYFFVDELPDQYCNDKYLTTMQDKEQASASSFEISSDDSFPCKIDSKVLADYYPSVKECVSADIFGPVTDEFIDNYLSSNVDISASVYCIFLDALAINKKERLFEVIDYTLYHIQIADYIMPSLKHLLDLPRTEELENYLISYMVEIEDDHKEIGRYIYQNLW